MRADGGGGLVATPVGYSYGDRVLRFTGTAFVGDVTGRILRALGFHGSSDDRVSGFTGSAVVAG